MATLIQRDIPTPSRLPLLLSSRLHTHIPQTGEINGSDPHKTAKMNKLLATCRRTSKPIDKIQLTELISYRQSMQDWSSKKSNNSTSLCVYLPPPLKIPTNHLQFPKDPPQLDSLPYEILLEVLAYIIPTRTSIRCKLFHSPMLGIPAGGLSIATVCKRIAAVVAELLYSRNWFEISGGAAAAAAAAAVFQKVSSTSQLSYHHIRRNISYVILSTYNTLFDLIKKKLISTTRTTAPPRTLFPNTPARAPRPPSAPSTTAWNSKGCPRSPPCPKPAPTSRTCAST